MDIFINQPIKYLELNSFFKEIFSENKFFLLYEGENDWEDIQDERIVFQYHLDDEKRNGFDSGIDVFQKGDDILPIIENLSFLLSRKFSCSVFCDASRLVMKEHNPYYSLLFESGRVYLAQQFPLMQKKFYNQSLQKMTIVQNRASKKVSFTCSGVVALPEDTINPLSAGSG